MHVKNVKPHMKFFTFLSIKSHIKRVKLWGSPYKKQKEQFNTLVLKREVHFTYLLRHFHVFSWCGFTTFQVFRRTALCMIAHVSYNKTYLEKCFLTNEKKKSADTFSDTLSTLNCGVIIKDCTTGVMQKVYTTYFLKK